MGQARDPLDPRGLIRDSYRIEGIGAGECRSIFLDWAMGLPEEVDAEAARQGLLAHYRPANPGHPMTVVLQEGLGETGRVRPRRRGGWRGRDRDKADADGGEGGAGGNTDGNMGGTKGGNSGGNKGGNSGGSQG